jgi:large subunit ribosomal protein L12
LLSNREGEAVGSNMVLGRGFLMEYVYAALLLHKLKQNITEDSVKNVVQAAGVTPDEVRVKALVAALSEVQIDEALKAAPVAVAATAAGPAAAAPAAGGAGSTGGGGGGEAAPKEEEKKEEEALEGLSSLFG